MNQPILLTKAAFNLLLSNLLEMEERMDEIFDDFLSKPSQETEKLKQLLNESINRLDSMLPYIMTVTTAVNEFPCVVVGSEVIIEDVCSDETCCYRLVSPLKKGMGPQEVSFLSPMGKAMLLKKVNDRFMVEAPGGNYEYKVLSIKIAVDFQN